MSEKKPFKDYYKIVSLVIILVLLLLIGFQNEKIKSIQSGNIKEIDDEIKKLKNQNDSLELVNKEISKKIALKDQEFEALNKQIDSLKNKRIEREVVFIDRLGKIEKMSKHDLEDYFRKELETIFP